MSPRLRGWERWRGEGGVGEDVSSRSSLDPPLLRLSSLIPFTDLDGDKTARKTGLGQLGSICKSAPPPRKLEIGRGGWRTHLSPLAAVARGGRRAALG